MLLLAIMLSLSDGARAAQPLRLRVMTYNIHSCKGRDGKIRPDRIAAVIAAQKPDLVALQEVRVGRVDAGNGEAGAVPPPVGEPPLSPPSVVPRRRPSDQEEGDPPFTDQPRVIARLADMNYVFYPLVRLEKEDYGIALLSRHPIRIVRAANLPTLPGRKPPERRGAIWVELDVDGRAVQALNTHLGLNRRERAAQIDALIGEDWMGGPKFAGPFVFFGDLNSRPSDRPYRLLSERAADAALLAGEPRRTFPSLLPVVRIDHVFVPRGASAQNASVPRTPEARAASDHLPLVVDVVLP